MNIIPIDSWVAFKSEIINLKKLVPQYVEYIDRYEIYAGDSPFIWQLTLKKNNEAEALDFETNYKSSSNKSLLPLSADGLPLVATPPAVDPYLVDTREGIYHVFDKDHLTAEWVIPYSYIQLQGIRLDIKDTECGDSLDIVELGYYVNENWVQLGWYGKTLYFTGGNYIADDHSNTKSNPLPQGIIIKITYKQFDVNSLSQKKCAIWFSFWRPYAT